MIVKRSVLFSVLMFIALSLLSVVGPVGYAAQPPLWVDIAKADSGIAVDYASIRVDGEHPALLMKLDSDKLGGAASSPFKTLVTRYSLDCASQMLRPVSMTVLDRSGNMVQTLTQEAYERETHRPGHGNLPLGNLKSLCLWRDHGFTVPDIAIEDAWESMQSSTSESRLFEAPGKRQLRDGIVLIKKKTESTPEIAIFGRKSRFAIAVSAYDCKSGVSHLTVAVRYDMEGKPIAAVFYQDSPDTPKLEVNRKRFADACNTTTSH